MGQIKMLKVQQTKIMLRLFFFFAFGCGICEYEAARLGMSFSTVKLNKAAADLGSVLLFASGPKSVGKVCFTPESSNSRRLKGRFVVGTVAAWWSAPRSGA